MIYIVNKAYLIESPIYDDFKSEYKSQMILKFKNYHLF